MAAKTGPAQLKIEVDHIGEMLAQCLQVQLKVEAETARADEMTARADDLREALAQCRSELTQQAHQAQQALWALQARQAQHRRSSSHTWSTLGR